MSACLLWLTTSTTPAVLPPVHEALPNFDRRSQTEPASLKEDHRAAIATLKSRAPDVIVDVVGQPNFKQVKAARGFLTESGGRGRAVSLATTALFPTNEAHLSTKAFVREHSALFGFGPETLDRARVKREFTTPHNSLKTVVWEQALDGISVFESVFISHTTHRGELVSLSSQFVKDPPKAAAAGVRNRNAMLRNPTIGARQAVAFAARNIAEELEADGVVPAGEASADAEKKQRFEASPLAGQTDTKLVWLPLNEDTMRLCWEVMLTSKKRGEMYRFLVDVENGEVLIRHCLTEYISDATYRVFTSDSPSPFSPTCPTPCTTQPAVVARTLVTLSALNTNASPNGWIDDGINETSGNNVDAHTDRDNNNSPDLPRPQGSPFRTFDFSMDLAQAPSTYTNASVTDLFYWCNWTHDRLYELGFTEAAGNFQNNNFGRGGLGNDALQADAQDGGGFNNANMSTPTDGSPPRMQMYVFDGPTPDRDGDFDHEIVIHEYIHGLSNRRVGGGVGLSALQSRGMGEGWSDWYGLALLSEAGDDVNGNYSAGGYATYLMSGLTQNYYYGIRRYPYSTDMTKNPLTFRDIDPGQASPHTGIPRSTIIGNTADEVHNQGEVWCVTLWEARANLIAKYGHAVGNELILQLVTDGMNLSPSNPNFLQARDGILQADVVNNGGANLPELWAAFAKRGMGISATSPSSSTTVGVVEAFDQPDDLSVLPQALSASGPLGGPFAPNPATFTLNNLGVTNLNWSLLNTSVWFNVSPSSGTLNTGGTNVTLSVTLTPAANSLPLGVHNSTIRFTNLTSGVTQSRTFAVNVVGRSMNDDFDSTIDLTQWSAFGGTVGSTVLANNYGGSISAPNSLWFGDAGSRFARTIPLDTSGGGSINFYIRLANGTSSTWETADLLPNEGCVLECSTNGGLNWTILGSYDTTAFYNWTFVTSSIPAAARSGSTYFQWRQKSNSGTGFDHWAIDSVSIDAVPAIILTLTLPSGAMEGDAPANGIVTASPAPTNDLVVTLTSGDLSEITVPASVTILAGQSNATVAVTIVDDAELDGAQIASVTATAINYSPANAAMSVLDNETATLSVNVPATVTEGVVSALGSVVASTAPTANITVSLNSSDTTEAQVPATVTLLAGQTFAPFNVTVINDTQIDGSQTATITAQVTNWTTGTGNILVQDNEPTNIVVMLPASAREGNGELFAVGQVRIFGTLATNLLVSVLSSDTTELTVPPLVTIFAGTTNTLFSVTVVDDADIDSSQIVTVSANAGGFSGGSVTMNINDDESPFEPFNPSPAHLSTSVIQTTDLSWSSGAVPGEVITNDVYFGTTPTPGLAELLGTTTNTTWDLPLLLPQTIYYWQIVARKAGITPGPVWQFTTRGVDHFVWDSVSSPKFVSEPFGVTITAKDAFETTVSNFTSTVNLSSSGSGGLVTNTLLPAPIHTSSSSGTYTLAYAFTPATNLTVTHVRSYSGTKISIWSDAGALLASQNVSGTQGTWTETPLASPLVLTAGNTYRVSFFTSGGNFYSRTDRPSTFPHGTIVGGYYYSTSDSFPSTFTSSSTIYLSDLRYTAGSSVTIPITPVVSGIFSNGKWSGNISALAPTTNLVLRADDGNGHTGLSNPFVVELQNDIAVKVTDSPDPVSLGGNVTYSITVTNIGPASASGVVVSNILPAATSLFSVTTSQGTFTSNGSLVTCDLGSMAGNTSASITIVATTTGVGTLSNHVSITRSDADAYLANNSAVATTTVQTPVITINDVSLFEGNSGTASAVFTVSVSPAPAAAVSVNFATANSSAISPGDFIATNGTLNFAIGQTNRSFAVPIVGDALYELDETYFVNLSSPVNATLSDSTGQGTIRNNDPIPTLSIGDVTLTEGNSATKTAVFPVTLSVASAVSVNFSYSALNGNASSGSDYVAQSGSLTIPAGSVSNSIAITVNGDLSIEPDEVFYVELSSVANATLLKREGVGLIVNDDGLPGEVDRFVWSAVAATQYVGQPFNVTLTALDAFDGLALNFTNSASLTGLASGLESKTILQNFTPNNSSTITSYTLGYSFTPTNNLTVTHVRSYFGNKVSIWTSAGVLLASQNVSATAGVWTDTPLTVPLVLTAGVTYRVAVYTSSGSYHWRTDATNTFPDGSIVQSYQGSGDIFPTSSDTIRWWAVDLRYSATGLNPTLLAPSVTGNFVDGIWNGNITALAPTTNFVVRASDGNGHFGNSGAMVVELRDDIGITVTDGPDPVAVGANLTYSITVTNTGPAIATGVIVTNLLPSSASLVSVTTSQGTSSATGQTVVCSLGAINGGGQATIQLQITNATSGIITNISMVSRAGADSFAGNNFATNTTSVIVPSLAINDASIAEGNNGTTNLVFSLSLSAASVQVVSVNFATANSSALAGVDYSSTNGTIVFAPGQTNRSAVVAVVGDIFNEPTEIFVLNLSSAINANITDSQAVATIVNDDPLPGVAVSDAVVTEGNSGTTNATFNVTLTPASGQTVSVSYFTANGTALTPSDYTSVSSTLFFNPGETNKSVVVTVNGDTTNELNETFSLNLNSPSNATNTDSTGLGTILNDDFTATVLLSGSVLVSETCVPTNGAIDPGEAITLNISLTNASLGGAITTNLTVTMLASGNISVLSGPQNFGALTPSGGAVSRPFSLAAIGNCGDALSAVLQLQDGAATLGTLTLPLRLGKLAVSFAENFDTVTAPALPQGWTVNWTGAGSPWATSTLNRDTLPNAAFCPDPSTTSVNSLNSPSFVLTTTNAQLSFRHSYGTESCCDRCYLQISINGGTYLDINTAGGSFLTNGYTSGGWGGSSGGFITTIARLPASALGQSINLRWHFTSDSSVSGTGWYVDSIALSDGYACCQSDSLVLTVTDSPDPVAVNGDLTYSLSVINPGPSMATGVTLSNLLPVGVTFVSAASSQGSCTQFAGVVTCDLGSVPAAGVATVTLLVTPDGLGTLTNMATVTRLDAVPNPTTTAQTLTTVITPSLSISNTSIVEGNSGIATAIFSVNLWPPAAQTVSVNYATTDVTAQAGSDYAATNGTLNFMPGETNRTIVVHVFGETNAESAETFTLTLSNAVNALIGMATGIGTIVNDDIGNAQLITFDDLPNTTSGLPVPVGYRGLTWSNLLAMNGIAYPGAIGYSNGVVSASNIVFNSFGDPGSIVSTNPFTLYSAYLTAAWSSNLQARIQGYAGGSLVYDQTHTLNRTNPTLINFNYQNVNEVKFSVSPSDWIVIDNVLIQPDSFLLPPAIITQPTNQTLLAGQTATLTAVASGDGSLTYQWLKNGVNMVNGGRVSGVGSDHLTIINLQTNDAGDYSLLVTSAYGSATSSNAALTVLAYPPTLVSQPANQTVAVGSPATFTVVASGAAPLRYQWRRENIAIIGATNASYSLSFVQYTNAGSYSVVVSNAFGFTNSSAATLTVVPYNTNVSFFASNKGWYDAGGNGPGGPNYHCGDIGVMTIPLIRNWFVFNVPPLPGPVLTAQLRVNSYNIASPSGNETYQLHHVSTPVTNLIAGGIGLVSIYNDLADGNIYGSRNVTTNEANQIITVDLNTAFITNLVAAAGQPFAIGGHISTLDTTNFNNEYIFGNSIGLSNDVQLLITLGVPSAQLTFLAPELVAGMLRLRVSTVDSSPITPARATNIWVYSSTNISLPLSNWTALSIAPILTNGLLRLDGINPTNPPALFFRAIEGSWNVRPLRLSMSQVSGNAFTLHASSGDGLPLTPIRAAKIHFYSSTNATLPFASWQPLVGTPILSNGVLNITGSVQTNSPSRYFRAEETP